MEFENGPEANSSFTQWAETVRTEHEQADRVRSDDPNADHWKKLAHRFAAATREKALQDETFIAVSKFVKETDTVLDVGAGAGRLAVPLAERCKHVTAVEPSEAMQSNLKNQVDAWGLKNLSVITATWEEADVEKADLVVCAHVVYTVIEIESFLRKLTTSSRRDVIVVVFDEPAMANYFPLWKLVYGEDRISLPTLPELKSVLQEMQIEFDVEQLPEWQSRPFPDIESAYEESLARLFISPNSANIAITDRLKSALADSLVSAEGGLRFKWARPHRPQLVRWSV